MDSDKIDIISARKTLQKYWNYPDFRKKQSQVVQTVLTQRNTLALLPTGGGKSICFQVPALMREGVTIVISPLISLMEDQVTNLRAKGIKADFIHSGLTKSNIDRILDNTIFGDIKLLYVAPERLVHPLFLARMERAKIALVAVDEAHCISQWGHDFRPSYLLINDFVALMKAPQVIAVTATATPKVVEEITNRLSINESDIIKGSFKRENISISLLKSEDKIGAVLKLVERLDGKTIVYSRSRRNVEMISSTLENHGYKAQYYHAGLSYRAKQKRQSDFSNGFTNIMSATNAFGMGIDIEDIRHVIHFDIPPSLEEYYQEIGRGGRDGKMSYATLLISEDNVAYSARRLKEDFQDFNLMTRIYKHLHVLNEIGIHEGEGKTTQLDINYLAMKLRMEVRPCLAAIKTWQKLGVVEITNDDKERCFIKISMTPRAIRESAKELGDMYSILEVLMRSYESIFEEWMEVDKERLILNLKLTEEDFITKLKILNRKGYLKLYESTSGQRLTFLQPRRPSNEMADFKPAYQRLEKMYKDRWASMKGLLFTTDCITHYILNYFGEKESKNCGLCLNCRKMKKSVDLLSKQRRDNEEG